MPSVTGTNLIADINRWVRNYAVESFHDMRLNSILLRLVGWVESIVGGGPTVIISSTYELTQADFINATDCPLTALNGLNLVIFFNDVPKYLKKSAGEWTDLAGGGFRILLPGFDATANSYNFFVTLKA